MIGDGPREQATPPEAVARALAAVEATGAYVTGFVCFIGIMTPEGNEGLVSASSQGEMLAAGLAATGLHMLTGRIQ